MDGLDELDREFHREQKECQAYYRRNLKGKTIKDVRPHLSTLGGLSSLKITFIDDTSMEWTSEEIKTEGFIEGKRRLK